MHAKFVSFSKYFLMLLILAGTAFAGGKVIPLTTNSEEARANFEKGITALETFQFQEVTTFAKKAVEADSNFAMAHMLLAATAQQDQRQTHIDKFTRLAANASKGEQSYLEGMVHSYKNEFEQALEKFNALAKTFPEDRRVRMMLGMTHMRLAKFDEAIADFEAANKIDASTPRATSFIGDCHLLKENYAKARDYYKQVIGKVDRDASPFGPFFGTAFTYLYEGKPEAAFEPIDEFLQRYNRNGGAQGFPPVWIWNLKGRINLESGRLEEAIRNYETGYKSVPPSTQPEDQKQVWLGRMHMGLARALAKMGKHNEAWQEAEIIRKGIEADTAKFGEYWPSYHYMAGYLKLEAGEYPKAIEHLKQADLEDVFNKLLLARAYLKTGQKDEALKLCDEITKFNTNNLDRALSYPEAKKIIAMHASN